MFQFFSRTYQNRSMYKLPMNQLSAAVTSFSENPTVVDSYYDEVRNEGFFKGKSYYLTFELHQTNEGIVMEVTTTCTLPFFIPKTYTTGFITYINNYLNM